MNAKTDTLATVATNYEAHLKTTSNCKWHTVETFIYIDPTDVSPKEVG